MQEQLDQLIEMSLMLGDPEQDLVILGEGNTSAKVDEHSFWVKASGTQLARADRNCFVRVASPPILNSLEQEELSDAQVKALLKAATVEGDQTPSIETFLHAMCLQLEGVRFVGHTHPTAALGLLCSQPSREVFAGSLFPDQIVLLGAHLVYVPYADPGLPLAKSVFEHVDQFVGRYRQTPRVILMENHGVIALGSTAVQVINITQMIVKTCRILAAALQAGGPRFLSDAHVARIDQRPDELERRSDLR